MKEISIYELMGRLQNLHNKELYLATKKDYSCYEMCVNNYEEDIKNNVVHIGYEYDRIRNGLQFSTVCTVRKGKITYLDLYISEKTINLCQLYIDNMKEKNTIITPPKPPKYIETPYESE